MKQWDVFLSHASEDKQAVALPLTETLRRLGVRVWLDEFQINIGDSVRRKIDEGLANSRFGVVILSETFLTKHWTGHELDALWERDVVLPVWHGIEKQVLVKHSPLLAGRKGISTSQGIDAVAQTIVSRVFKPSDGSEKGAAEIARDLAVLLVRPAAVNELVAFVADHPKILTRSLGVHIDSKDFFRVAVPLGSDVVDFCVANYQPTSSRFSDYQFVLLGPAGSALFDEHDVDADLGATLQRAHNIAMWLRSNVAAARQVLRDVPSTVLIKVVAGRRPQPGSPILKALQDLNDELIGVQVRTYDWFLDSALSLSEHGEDA